MDKPVGASFTDVWTSSFTFKEYLLSTYSVPGTVLTAGDRAVKKIRHTHKKDKKSLSL